MINEIPGPVWPDACGRGGYVGSFRTYPDGNYRPQECDLYVWRNDRGHHPEVNTCIRFGAGGGDYYSPCGVHGPITGRDHEPYSSAHYMLLEKGFFSWEPHKTPSVSNPVPENGGEE